MRIVHGVQHTNASVLIHVDIIAFVSLAQAVVVVIATPSSKIVMVGYLN